MLARLADILAACDSRREMPRDHRGCAVVVSARAVPIDLLALIRKSRYSILSYIELKFRYRGYARSSLVFIRG